MLIFQSSYLNPLQNPLPPPSAANKLLYYATIMFLQSHIGMYNKKQNKFVVICVKIAVTMNEVF